MHWTLLLASSLFLGTLAMPQGPSIKNHLEARVPEEDGDAGSEPGNNSGGDNKPRPEESDDPTIPLVPPAQYISVPNYGCNSLFANAWMPDEKDGVVETLGCAKTGQMLNDWPMPNPDGIWYDESATDFDDSSSCNLYLSWAQGDDIWIAFVRDASNHPMGGIGPQNRSGLNPPGVFSLGTGGWTMTVTEATNEFSVVSPPDNSGLSFVWAQSGGGGGEVAWASNLPFYDSNNGYQGGCEYSEDPTAPQKSKGGMVGMRYWQCPFLCKVAHK